MQQSGARQKEKKQRGDPSAASLLLALAAPLLARLAHSKNASEWENVLMLLLFFSLVFYISFGVQNFSKI
jgi:hypothetical protein